MSKCPLEFHPKDKVVSLVYHPPEIMPGTVGTIYSGHIDNLYAVQLPNGELHRWFAEFELQPVNNQHNCCDKLCIGSCARILTTEGHPPEIRVGMVVKIVKILCQEAFYDLIIHGEYHRWLAEFEITSLAAVSKCEKC